MKDVIIDQAVQNGLSKARAKSLLRLAEAERKVHRWVKGANQPVRYATTEQPLIEMPKTGKP